MVHEQGNESKPENESNGTNPILLYRYLYATTSTILERLTESTILAFSRKQFLKLGIIFEEGKAYFMGNLEYICRNTHPGASVGDSLTGNAQQPCNSFNGEVISHPYESGIVSWFDNAVADEETALIVGLESDAIKLIQKYDVNGNAGVMRGSLRIVTGVEEVNNEGIMQTTTVPCIYRLHPGYIKQKLNK